MPKLAAELTDKVMRNLPVPETGNLLYYDPELKGFTARVTCKNARAFVGVYHFEGVERRDTIGGFPEWTARAAREVFKRWKRDVDLGIDPRGELAPDDPLFKPLAEQFLAHGRTKRGRELRPATVRAYRRGLIVYAARLHSRPVQSIRRREIAALIETVATECGTTAAMCAKAALSRFFGWLVAKDLVDANPVAGVEGYVGRQAQPGAVPTPSCRPSGPRARSDRDYSTDRSDMPVDRLQAQRGGRHDVVGAGRRRVDASRPARTKNHRALVLPLPRQARAALESWPRFVGRDHLFGAVALAFKAGRAPRRDWMPGYGSTSHGTCTTAGARSKPGWPRSAFARRS